MIEVHVIPNEAKRNEESPEDHKETSVQTSGDSSLHFSCKAGKTTFGMTAILHRI